MIREYECSCGETVEALSWLIGYDEDGLPVFDIDVPDDHAGHELSEISEEAQWRRQAS